MHFVGLDWRLVRDFFADYFGEKIEMILKKLVLMVATLGLSIAGNIAIAEPMTASATRLAGKTQSECLRTAESGLKAAGFENVSRGQTASTGQPGSSYFANDKPYYAVVFCEGDVAFISISGPSSDKRREIHGAVFRAIRGQ
jgi:hypothetical protein